MRDDGIVRQPPSTASSPNPNASSGCLGIQRRRPRFVSPHGDASGQASKELPRQGGSEYTQTMLSIYEAVKAHGVPNYRGARIKLPTNLCLGEWEKEIKDMPDGELLDYLIYGFPVSYRGPIPTPNTANHASALHHPSDVTKYVTTEVAEGAMLGPFAEPLFTPWSHCNPLMTRPKKASADRRVILDLSFPHAPGHSVNGGTPTDVYEDKPYKLRLPTIQDLAALVVKCGPGSFLFSRDIARCYRQLPIDPADWPLVGLHTQEGHFTDLSLPFGLRWAAMAAQRTMQVIAHRCSRDDTDIVVYIDDLAGVATTRQEAQRQFQVLGDAISSLGLQEAAHKASPPAQQMVWLGFLLDTVDMTLSIPADKLRDIDSLLQQWNNRQNANRQQLQSILGKLFHVAQCVEPARKFLNRMLATLRACPQSGYISLDEDFKKDLSWFRRYMADTNGVYIMPQARSPVINIQVDSCLTGAGAVCLSQGQCYHQKYPENLLDKDMSICHLECINALAALRLWAPGLRQSHVNLYSDSATAVAVLQEGRGRDVLLQAAAREFWLIAANHDLDLQVLHIPGEQQPRRTPSVAITSLQRTGPSPTPSSRTIVSLPCPCRVTCFSPRWTGSAASSYEISLFVVVGQVSGHTWINIL